MLVQLFSCNLFLQQYGFYKCLKTIGIKHPGLV